MAAGLRPAIDPRRVANTRATDRTRHELGDGKPPHDVGLPYHATTAHRFGSERMRQELAVANSIGERSSSDSQNSKTPLVRRSNERRGGYRRFQGTIRSARCQIKCSGTSVAQGLLADPATTFEWLASLAGKTHRNASANLFWAFIIPALRLIDTRHGSPNSRYVKSFVEYSSAALLRPVLPAPSCECYLRR